MISASDQSTAIAASQTEHELAGLLERLRERDTRALDQLYGRTVDRLYALACKVAGDPRDAEEVVADVYQYAWEHADQFDPQRGAAIAWLSMLTWSRAADRRRRRKPEVDIESLHPDHTEATYREREGTDDMADLEAFIDGHRVRVALSQVRADQRRLILMAFFEGASHGDIAQRTGMPLGTVKSHIRRGMESLRAQLEGATGHGR